MRYEIGTKLKMYRENMKLSQKDFAALIGVSNSRVSNWEQGINRPDIDKLSVICAVLNVSSDELLDIHLINNGLTSNDKKLIEKYNKLPLSERKLIDDMVNAMITKNNYQKLIQNDAVLKLIFEDMDQDDYEEKRQKALNDYQQGFAAQSGTRSAKANKIVDAMRKVLEDNYEESGENEKEE